MIYLEKVYTFWCPINQIESIRAEAGRGDAVSNKPVLGHFTIPLLQIFQREIKKLTFNW